MHAAAAKHIARTLIALVPGFCEEVFFRGYMQRRLLQAWSPWSAILVTSLLFGVLHLNPAQSLFAFLFGTTAELSQVDIARLYPGGREDYLAKFAASLDSVIAAGFLLTEDRPEILALAAVACSQISST